MDTIKSLITIILVILFIYIIGKVIDDQSLHKVIDDQSLHKVIDDQSLHKLIGNISEELNNNKLDNNKLDNNKLDNNKLDNNKLDKKFYEIEEIEPKLNIIYENLTKIKIEVENVQRERWTELPKTYLYKAGVNNENVMFNNSNKVESKDKKYWDIFPLKAFGVTGKKNCEKCPELYKFIESIPGVQVAILSRLMPGTKLNIHRGSGRHSNNIIRCHFGFKVPYGCYVGVRNKINEQDQIKLHKQNKWIAFDDSKYHYSHNPTKYDRIVLIVDINRPLHIKTGTSTSKDIKELLNIIASFKENN
jgi:hypothetical protein